MLLKGSSPAKVLVVSTSPDAVNHNATIRTSLRHGFEDVLGAAAVRESPLELAEEAVAEFRPSLVVALGSVAIDAAPLRGLPRSVRRAGLSETGNFHVREHPRKAGADNPAAGGRHQW